MPAPSLAATGKRAFWRRWIVWLTVFLVLAFISSIHSGRRTKIATQGPSTPAPILTKAEWKRKASGVSRLVGSQLIAETRPFAGLMGAPDRTQAVQGKVIWYYICADGRIQLVMFGDPNNGAIIADVNEY